MTTRGMGMLAGLVCACSEDPDPWIVPLEPPPVRAVEIQVTAHRDGCDVTHQNGVHARELVAPIDTPIRLVFTSTADDVDVDIGNPSIREHVVARSYRYLVVKILRAGPFAFACPAGVPSTFTALAFDEYAKYLDNLPKR